jgi:cation diffusion facilitator family transporter
LAGGSTRVVIAALLGNGAIAVTKYVAAALTGSSAMFAEAVHSTVDTGNQALLLFGMNRAERPADARHPFGHGMEIYFWAFVVAILLFGLGAGVSLYEGVHKLANPEPLRNVVWNYVVIGLAIVFEAGAWIVAWREFDRVRGKLPVLRAVRQSKDPALFTVLFEDTAALAGLVAALVGIFAADRNYLTAGEVEAGVSALEAEIKARHPEVSRVFIEIQAADRSEPGLPPEVDAPGLS